MLYQCLPHYFMGKLPDPWSNTAGIAVLVVYILTVYLDTNINIWIITVEKKVV